MFLLPERVLLLAGDVLAMISGQEAPGSGRDPGKPFGQRTGVHAEGPQVFILRVSEGDRDFADVLQRILCTAPRAVYLVIGTDGNSGPIAEMLHRSGDQYSASAIPTLTPRQVEVLKNMAEGVTEREIARRLAISERTVQLHVANISRALGASSHFQLGLTAARLGLP